MKHHILLLFIFVPEIFKQLVKTKRHIRIFATALLVLFAAYYTNVSFFYHCHTINGVTIVHSHIHSSNHAGTEATESEVTLISTLSQFHTFVTTLFFLEAIVFAIREIILGKPNTGYLSNRLTGCITLRAPPATNYVPHTTYWVS